MKKRNYFSWIGGAGVIVLLVIMLGWGRINDPHRAEKKGWEDAGVGCLPNHANASLHIHQDLMIRVDGEEEAIPAEIGIVPGCMAEVHTHDATGMLHVESVDPKKELTLGHFFAVWGEPLEREGHTLAVSVNGGLVEDPVGLVLKDSQIIVLEYQSEGSEAGKN